MCVTFLKAILAKLYVGYSPVELQTLSFSNEKKDEEERKRKRTNLKICFWLNCKYM